MTKAGGELATSVTLRDPKFRLTTFPAGSTPPAWARALITSPKAWRSAPESTSTPEGDDSGTSEEGTQEDAPPAPEDVSPAEAPQSEEDLVGELPEPPKRGAGSGRDAWVAYANSKGVEFPSNASRDDIIDAIEASE